MRSFHGRSHYRTTSNMGCNVRVHIKSWIASLVRMFRAVPAVEESEQQEQAFEMPPQVKSRRFKSGDRAGPATGPPRPIQRLVKMLFRCRRTLMRKWAGAPSCCKPHCLSYYERHINVGSVFCRKPRYVSPFSRSGSRTGPSRQNNPCPDIDAEPLVLRCFNHSVRIACGPQMTIMQVNDAIATKGGFIGEEDRRQKSHNGNGLLHKPARDSSPWWKIHR